MIVGLDFDNTVINYDLAIHRYAVENGFCDFSVSMEKKAVRDAVRRLEDGEMKWRQLQGYVYGPGIGGGVLNAGATGFVRACLGKGIPVFIVSHKTRHAAIDETGTDLRACALAWMVDSGFLKETGLSPKDVFFEDTRFAKIERLKSLHCTHFIDDLEETFIESTFPENVVKILFSAHGMEGETDGGMVMARSFDDIGRLILQEKA